MEKIICKFDSKPKATIGFVQVASDMTIDRDIGPVLRQIPGILWRSARMRFEEGDVEINENVYERSKKYISEASKSFLPLNNKLYGSIDIMAMFCTSMSFVLGRYINIGQNFFLNPFTLSGKFPDVAESRNGQNDQNDQETTIFWNIQMYRIELKGLSYIILPPVNLF